MKKKVYDGEYAADLVDPRTIFEINEVANSANFFVKLEFDLQKIKKRYIKSLKKFIPRTAQSIIIKHERYINEISWLQYNDFESDDPCFTVYPVIVKFNNSDEIFEELKLTFGLDIRDITYQDGNNEIVFNIINLNDFITKSDLNYLLADLIDLNEFLEIRWHILSDLYGQNSKVIITKDSLRTEFHLM